MSADIHQPLSKHDFFIARDTWCASGVSPGLHNAAVLGTQETFAGISTQKCSAPQKLFRKISWTLFTSILTQVRVSNTCWGWIFHSHTHQVCCQFRLQRPQEETSIGSPADKCYLLVLMKIRKPSGNRQYSVFGSKGPSQASESCI